MPELSYVPDRARRAERALQELGFTVSYGSRARLISDDGTTAGTGRDRAADLMEAFEDPAVNVILAAGAGLGSRDLLEFLDPATIAANPKPFSGFCDNVYLHLYLATNAGISSLYGCDFIKHFGEAGGAFPETTDYFTRALASTDPLVCTPVPSRIGKPVNWYIPEIDILPRQRTVEGGWTWLRPGTVRGTLIGGEITMIPELVRRFGLSLESTILFWDLSHHGLPVRPLFKDMCESTDVTKLAGMIVGAHPTITPAEWTRTVADLADEFVPETTYPIMVNADLSHLCPSWTVPYGEEVLLDPAGSIVFPRRSVTEQPRLPAVSADHSVLRACSAYPARE
jgi:muramoyltetrapeptide carboxypeptidase LdcA involved in peptidoglycan recycling